MHGVVAGLVSLRRRRNLYLVLEVLDPFVNRFRILVIVATYLLPFVPGRLDPDTTAFLWAAERRLVLLERHIIDALAVGREVRHRILVIFIAAVWLIALVVDADALPAHVVELSVELGALLHLAEHQNGVVDERLRED